MPRSKQSNSNLAAQVAEQPPPYNLWFEPWITLERHTGELERHGIEYTLLHAHEFRAIYDPSPLVVVGIYRLLTAILQDAIDPQNEDELHEIWGCRGFSPEAVHQFGTTYSDTFDLFSLDRPFLQSNDLPLTATNGDNSKSVAALFPEMPAGTEVTHYYRASESDYVFSPAAAAAGLCTIPAFASSGGAGIKPSINGVPPIYVIPSGNSLFESLVAGLLVPAFRPQAASVENDDAWWRREACVERSKERASIGYLHSLTFPARRMRLHPTRVDAICTRTGQPIEWGVRTMIFEMGECRPENAPWWQDPFVAYRLPAQKKSAKSSKAASPKTKGLPVPIRPQEGKATWREFGGLFVHQATDVQSTVRPRFIEQMTAFELINRRSTYSFQCVGLRTDGKAKTFEWVEFGFEVPPVLLNDNRTALYVNRALAFAGDCGAIISSVFARHFGGKSRKSERYATIRERMSASYWSALASEFREFILHLGDQTAQQTVFERWLNTVIKTARTEFRRAAETVGDDAADLRKRTEAEQECTMQLNAKRRKEMPHE